MLPVVIASVMPFFVELCSSIAAEIGKKKSLSLLEEQGEPIINHHLGRALVRALVGSLIKQLNAWCEIPVGKQNKDYALYAIKQLQVISDETEEKNKDWNAFLEKFNDTEKLNSSTLSGFPETPTDAEHKNGKLKSSTLNQALEAIPCKQPMQASELGKKAMEHLIGFFQDPATNNKALDNFCKFLSKEEGAAFNRNLYELFREEIKKDPVTFNAFTIDFLSQIYANVKDAFPNADALADTLSSIAAQLDKIETNLEIVKSNVNGVKSNLDTVISNVDNLPDKIVEVIQNSGILRTNETHQNSWIYVDGSRPAIDPERIFGREKELESIENILNDKSALVITGLRGTGKSILASMFIERMEKSGKFDGIYWRKVDETTTISDIIGSFFIVIGKPVKKLEHYKIPDQISLLLKELKEAPYFLVLDNFEILLDPQTNKPLESKVGFSDLIEISKDNCIRSKILFTCWDSLSSERGFRPSLYHIMGLDTSAGISLLKREGLNEPENELRKGVEMAGGHPLALILLAQLVIGGADTFLALLNDDSLWIGKDGEVAENILNKVYNDRLLEDERNLLQYVSIFRRPVPAQAICAIANGSEWSESKVRKIALNLVRKSLLQKQLNGENYWEESLISRYAGNKLSEKFKRHKLACEYFLSIPLPSKPATKEDIQSLIEAHYHACMAKDYNMAFDIIFDYEINQTLDLWGNYTVLVDLYTKMLSEDHFGNEILLENKVNHVAILGSLGNAYYQLGDAKKAIDYYDQALKIDPEDESVWYNKACAHSLMNKKSEALADLKRAVELNPSYRESAKSDKDFEKLWEDQDFKDIIAVNQG